MPSTAPATYTAATNPCRWTREQLAQTIRLNQKYAATHAASRAVYLDLRALWFDRFPGASW